MRQSKSNDINTALLKDLLSSKNYDGRDDINNSPVDSMVNLISGNIDFVINFSELNVVNLKDSFDYVVPISLDHDLNHFYETLIIRYSHAFPNVNSQDFLER